MRQALVQPDLVTIGELIAPSVGWLAFRDRLQSEIDEEAAEQERNETHRRHVNALTPFYHAYCRDSPRPKAFLPTSWCLAGLPAFKAWLGKDDPLFDDELWADRLPLIEAALDDYADGVRVKAIRKILSVTAGVQLETLSTKREDYPRSKYDDCFFRKPTSLVSVAAQGFSYYRVRQTRLVPFPECMEGRGEGDTHYSLAYGIDKRQVYFIRMILDIAGLDEATATTDDLDNLGTRFRWTNAESAQRREKAYTWTDLVRSLSSVLRAYIGRLSGFLPIVLDRSLPSSVPAPRSSSSRQATFPRSSLYRLKMPTARTRLERSANRAETTLSTTTPAQTRTRTTVPITSRKSAGGVAKSTVAMRRRTRRIRTTTLRKTRRTAEEEGAHRLLGGFDACTGKGGAA